MLNPKGMLRHLNLLPSLPTFQLKSWISHVIPHHGRRQWKMARHRSHRPHQSYHPLNILEKLLLLLFKSSVTSLLQENQLWALLMRSSGTIISSSLWVVPEKSLRAWHAIAPMNMVSRIFIVNRRVFLWVVCYWATVVDWFACACIDIPSSIVLRVSHRRW